MIKRRLFKLGLWLLLGAIINVAVAWGIVCLVPIPSIGHVSNASSLRKIGCVSSSFGSEYSWDLPVPEKETYWENAAGKGTGWVMKHKESVFSLDRNEIEMRGWPLRSLCWRYCVSSSGRSAPMAVHGIDLGGEVQQLSLQSAHGNRWSVWRPGVGTKVLPLHPLWPGFAVNTVFYAAVLWVMFAGPGWIRRRGRIRRGLCPACAYPVGTSQVCTECGKPVPTEKIGKAIVP
jgi:hypothetical protein